jgi:glycine/D-amino acid oxidase-like deaminating enzyme
MPRNDVEIVVVGAGIVGIATAYYLCTRYKKASVLLLDSRQPMSFTSAQSGDNYRNWWPHATMTAFTNDSIDLMEQIASATSNVMNMTRRGYLLATRSQDVGDLITDLHVDFRIHDTASSTAYLPPDSDAWESAPDGVDILSNQTLIRQSFPALSNDIANVIHIRRGGDISGQQLGQYMLEQIKKAGGKRLAATVQSIDVNTGFLVHVNGPDGIDKVKADVLVNAAGPFAGDVAAMVGVELPVENIYQQKIAFEDVKNAVPRQSPFSIDLDTFHFEWTDEEREFLTEDEQTAWLTGQLPGGTHCRPEGGDNSKWIKLGWAFNRDTSEPQQDLANEPKVHPQYPEIVMRSAARLNPGLAAYAEDFPSRFSHYGGYYPMTQENWPLIGPLGVDGAFVAGALSGFGSMSACAAGATCAAWIVGGELPGYAKDLSLARYSDDRLMTELNNASSKGLL